LSAIIKANGRLPFYMRVDLSFSQEVKTSNRLRIKPRQEMLNFYNRGNTLGYELAFTRLVPQYMSGRIINFGARMWF